MLIKLPKKFYTFERKDILFNDELYLCRESFQRRTLKKSFPSYPTQMKKRSMQWLQLLMMMETVKWTLMVKIQLYCSTPSLLLCLHLDIFPGAHYLFHSIYFTAVHLPKAYMEFQGPVFLSCCSTLLTRKALKMIFYEQPLKLSIDYFYNFDPEVL